LNLIATQNVTVSPQVKTVTFQVRLLHECYYARLSSSALTGVISTISDVFTVAYSSDYYYETFD
jgi:hypothetical protein